ncbi:MAG: polysaccharide deacetylase family protein [Candidatus Methanoplasma sp.]|jgi:peptidoglycan/xylan/chitin deacetylase (PgdA/CDA1 family)|nr:polysaccharide deacetylase family protein [Candidatus Methanoplasma sp.]
MRALCVTVDLDRDVNIPIPGSNAAGSADRGNGTAPRFSSSERGLSLLADLFDELSIKATFFAEAATLRRTDAGKLSGHEVGVHGVDHEDFTLIKGADEKRAILREAVDTVKDAVGKPPGCFRSPYMKADQETIDMLPEFGIRIDSSRHTEMASSLIPKYTDSRVLDIPVPEGRDAGGKKISAYLWPMHESKRGPEDYLRMASVMEEGAFVIATHTWHMVESRERGLMSKDEAERNADNVRKVLEGIMDMDMRPSTMTDVRKELADERRTAPLGGKVIGHRDPVTGKIELFDDNKKKG